MRESAYILFMNRNTPKTSEAKMADTFSLSIEPTGGNSFLHGFHLGTIESVARQCAEREFNDRNATGRPTCTVALIRCGRIFDVYDGKWSAEYDMTEE